MQHRLKHIQKAAIISWLKDDELAKLARRSEILFCKRNSTLFSVDEQGKNIYLVKQGKVKLAKTSASGHEIILDILGPGELFGELSLVDENISFYSAVAVDDLQVYVIPRSIFKILLQSHPDLALKVLKLACMRRHELEMRLEDLIFQPLANRLALTLLWQVRRHGVQEIDGSISLQLTQNDLAHLVGASRESVADRLAKFKKAGLLRTAYRAIQLIDTEGLMQTLSIDSVFECSDLMPLRVQKIDLVNNRYL